jgi:hypothetical protein
MKLLANHAVDVAVQFVNSSGNPAEVDGAVDWMSSNPAVASVEAKPGAGTETASGMIATITAGPSAGEAVITAVADSDLGEGTVEVEATLSITVIAKGVAIGGEISPITGPSGPGIDNSLPGGSGGSIDNSLPHGQRPVDPGFDQNAPGRPDQGLPDSQPAPDQGLPGQPGAPDQGLPPTAAPKS